MCIRDRFTVQPGSFYPPPKVTSAVIQLQVREQPAVQVENEEGFFKLVRAAFGQRRKTAANSISSGLGPVSYTHLDVYKRQAALCAGPVFL